MKHILLAITLLGFSLGAIAQSVEKEIALSSNSAKHSLEVMNINGPVTLTGYDGNTIKLNAEELKADDDYKISIKNEDGHVLIYIDGPGVEVKRKEDRWSYRMNTQKGADAKYNIKVMVPNNIAVKASTVNKGDVLVTKMNDSVKANNVNGHVRVENVNSQVEANTVNGDIWVQSKQSPRQKTKFNTVNGEIHLEYPASFSGSVAYNSLHGDFFTNYDYKLGSETKRTNKGNLLKIGSNSVVEIGEVNANSPKIQVNTVNGSIYLKKSTK